MTWTKEDCPFCQDDGKVWEWRGGGQKYVKCDHHVNGEVIIDEMRKLTKRIDDAADRLDELRWMRATSIEYKKVIK